MSHSSHPMQHPSDPPHFRLHFEPLSALAPGIDVPCDSQGGVALDKLGERLRNDYFFARACIGHLFTAPVILQRASGCPSVALDASP